MSLKGIDVSSYNGTIDWKKVKGNVDFAILRCHQKDGIDSTFKANYNGCMKNGIPVGVYKYSYAMSIADAKKEAKEVIKVLKGKRLQYPVFYDLEYAEQKTLGANKIQKMAIEFMRLIIKEGYGVGIYCNKDWYTNHITAYLKKYFQFWIASYPYNDTGEVVERLKPSKAFGWQYSEKGKIPGIDGYVDLDVFYLDDAATSSVTEKPVSTPPATDAFTSKVTAQDALNVMRSWLGLNEYDGSHKKIVDIYNSYTPHPRGYALSYDDAWCDATVSACFIQLASVDMIGGIECGVEEHVKKFVAAGIWIEDGSITPQPGDLIIYNWDDGSQPNDGYSDHIGMVETVANGTITTIEGNSSNSVKRSNIPVGYGYIRGFARPKYDKA